MRNKTKKNYFWEGGAKDDSMKNVRRQDTRMVSTVSDCSIFNMQTIKVGGAAITPER